MRVKSDRQSYFNWATGSDSKIVLQYERKYNRISQLLDENPRILDAIDRDLRRMSRKNPRGRKSTYTSENLLRALIVHQIEQTALRVTMVRISHSLFLQGFVRLGPRAVMDFTLLDKALKCIQPKTWQKVNDLLRDAAIEAELIDGSRLRADTTVVEANIHYPTDCSLLWDSYRTLYRLLSHARDVLPGVTENRFHIRKVKKLHIFVTRYTTSPDKKRQRKVKKYRLKLIEQVERIALSAKEFADEAVNNTSLKLWAIGEEIRLFLPRIHKVVGVARRAWIKGETVPASDRIFSIFEDHVELIKRGRKHKPVEFGHMILLGQSREKFITQYDVMEKKIPDCYLPESILDRHERAFGCLPKELAADGGFCGDAAAMEELRKKVKVVAIPQRLKDWMDEGLVALQHFRAGIEGSISVLKRAFGLLRCQYRGFKSFVSHVAMGVFCHNLVILSGLSKG